MKKTNNEMLKKALCKTIAKHCHFSYEEVYKSCNKLKSIDKTIAVINIASLNNLSLKYATEIIVWVKTDMGEVILCPRCNRDYQAFIKPRNKPIELKGVCLTCDGRNEVIS